MNMRGGVRTRLLSIVSSLLIWEVAADLIGHRLFPSCSATFQALVSLAGSGLLIASMAASLLNLAAGFALAAGMGLLAGAAMARVPGFGRLAGPYVTACLAVPNILFVPVLFTLFGATSAAQIGVIVLSAIFVIATTTAGALEARTPALEDMARAFGANRWQLFWKIDLPQARPSIVGGLRLGAAVAVKGMVNAEMFIAYRGVGALIRTYTSRIEPDRLLACVLVIAAIGWGFTAAMSLLDPRSRRRAGSILVAPADPKMV
jgi:NitT/TauT family transport system permease protein